MYLGGIATHKKNKALVRSTFYHMLSFGYCCCNFFTCIQNTSLQHYLALACFRAVLGQGKKEEKFRIAVVSQKIILWEIILVYLSWYSTTPTYVSYVHLTYSVFYLVVLLVESSVLDQQDQKHCIIYLNTTYLTNLGLIRRVKL